MLRKAILATLVVGTVIFASGCSSCTTCKVEEPVCTTCEVVETPCSVCDL